MLLYQLTHESISEFGEIFMVTGDDGVVGEFGLVFLVFVGAGDH